MAKLTKEDTDQWKTWLKAAYAWREPTEHKWDSALNALKGKILSETPDTDAVAINLLFPMVRVIIPGIYSRNPDIQVYARRQEFETAALTMQNYLKYLVKEIGLKNQIKLVILDALIASIGWIKTGYEFNFEEEAEGELPASKRPKLIAKVLKSMQEFVEGKELGDRTRVKEIMYAINPNERVAASRPWALRASPWSVVVPAFSTNPDELPWIAERFVRPLSEVKDNPRFKNTKNLEASSNALDILRRQNRKVSNSDTKNTIDPDLDYYVYHEIYDCKAGRIYVIGDDDSELPLYEDDNPYFDILDSRHPYVSLRFNEVPDEFYPMNDYEAWEPQSEELNHIRTQMNTHRKRFNRKYVYEEGAFKTEALEQLKDSEDGLAIPTTSDSPTTALTPVQDAPLSSDVYNVEQIVKEDINNISMITDYQRGNINRGAKTATEAQIVSSESRSRSDERIDIVGDFACRVIRNIAQLSQEFMEPDQVYPILGDDTIGWIKIKDRDAIKGEFFYDIQYGSTLPRNPDVERQQFMQIYPILTADPYFDPIKPRMQMLKLFGVKDPEGWMNKELQAMLREKQKLDIMRAMREAMGGGEETEEGTTESETGAQETNIAEEVPTPASLLAKPVVPGGTGGGSFGPVV